ncbi:hypothetical protein GOP47_0011918 [Adiantum capillus-veneris]|uniref:Pentatricopeptide repeat-containing protein n=1 Tax=Adiantum capillus-veneris TaxID=13818 RepID=A0A9D4UTM9_ADICA|nr:hypothetical protein GOP47_0011918 [Adiantum capillus-veneris]
MLSLEFIDFGIRATRAGQKASSCFQQMQSEGISLDAITYECILKACGSMRDADMSLKNHGDIVSQRLLKKDVLGNALVHMCVKCGALQRGQKVSASICPEN